MSKSSTLTRRVVPTAVAFIISKAAAFFHYNKIGKLCSKSAQFEWFEKEEDAIEARIMENNRIL